MDVGLLDACTLGAGEDHVEEAVSLEAAVGVGGEERVSGDGFGAVGEIAPEVAFGGVGDIEIALFVAFAVADEDL